MYAEHFNKAMEARVRAVASELRRRGFHGQALHDELERRARGHRDHLAKQLCASPRPAVATKAAEIELDRWWKAWQSGGRDAFIAEAERLGI
jgi:hypothetical protein